MHYCGNQECRKEIPNPTRGQKTAITRGYDIYCGPDCSLVVSTARNYKSYLKRRKPPAKRRCKRCQDWFQPKSNNQKHCDDPKKRCAYNATRERNKKHRVKVKAKKPKMEVKPKRRCRICGKDPSPNYFFCRSCHGRVNDCFGVADEHPVGVMAYQ